jgi:hypothetical protein
MDASALPKATTGWGFDTPSIGRQPELFGFRKGRFRAHSTYLGCGPPLIASPVFGSKK